MADTTDFGGLLFGGGGSGLEGYLTPEQQQGLSRQAMLAAGASLLASSGPRRYDEPRINTGQIIGQALMSGMQGYNQAAQGTMANMIAGQKMLEAKRLADIQKQVAATFAEQPTPAEGAAPLSETDMKFNQYMKLANIYAMGGKGEEAKRYQEMAFQIKPRAEVTGAPFEVSDATGKPLLVQQMKDGTLKTVEGFGPKRDIQLVDLGGRTVAVDKTKLTGAESFAKTLAPQIVGGAETGYYAVGGGGGGGAAPRTAPAVGGAGGQVPQGVTTPSSSATNVVPSVVPQVNQQQQTILNQPMPISGARQIIAGTGPKPPEAFLAKSYGIQNTNDAVNRFSDALIGFKTEDMVNPERRAALSSAHSNAMLQAKELYNLGVLTGGDEAILNKVLANPVDLTSAFTPISAIKKQADDLQTVLRSANKNLAKVYRQPEVPLEKATSATSATGLTEGQTGTSRSGKPIVVRNGKWEYQ